MKLDLKHLACYLPYGLQVKLEFRPDTEIPWYYENKEYFTLEGMMLDWWPNEITSIKPKLRPLSDLIDDKFYSWYSFDNQEECIQWILEGRCPSDEWLTLVEKHGDVFNLIPNGLAINLNTINQNEQ